MARNAMTTPNEPIPFGHRESTRLLMVVLGSAILLGALVAPWWTRGMTIDWSRADSDGDVQAGDNSFWSTTPGTEGLYFNYRPFQTPGNGVSTDAGREAAVAVLGIALVACALCIGVLLAVRWLAATGRIESNPNIQVRLAIAAFLAGTFAVLWGALFLPLAGPNPGALWGAESGDEIGPATDGIIETTRYANVGFYMGLVGAIGFPAYLWFDAARTRALATWGASAGATTGTTA